MQTRPPYLVINDESRARAEAADRAERVLHGRTDLIDLGDGDAEVLRDALARGAQHAKRHALLKEHPHLVAVLELNLERGRKSSHEVRYDFVSEYAEIHSSA